MSIDTISNVIKQAVNPGRFTIMAKKVWKRLFDDSGRLDKTENMAWIKSKCIDFETTIGAISEDIWIESQIYWRTFRAESAKTLQSVGHDLGGGGIYPVLYFAARFSKPDTIVETGVAAGFSSHAFLSAISLNGFGRLYSSDFPYFRLPNPEQFIGILVDEDLRDKWNLLIEGDEKNLPRIASQISSVDIFHYDSDKTYSGKTFAMNTLEKFFHESSIIIFDDIQDDSFFHDYVQNYLPPAYSVFEFEKKYVGVIGDLSWRFNI